MEAEWDRWRTAHFDEERRKIEAGMRRVLDELDSGLEGHIDSMNERVRGLYELLGEAEQRVLEATRDGRASPDPPASTNGSVDQDYWWGLASKLVQVELRAWVSHLGGNGSWRFSEYGNTRDVLAEIRQGGIDRVGHVLLCASVIAATLAVDLGREQGKDPLEVWQEFSARGRRP
jgi:hypothetical protein